MRSEVVPRVTLENMRESLADSFGIAALSLSPVLVPRSERERLRLLSRHLPPIHCAGFECSLTRTRGRVDLQQRITRRDSELDRMAAYLLASGLCAQTGWRRIRDFMLAWSKGEFAQHIVECWLEYEPAQGGTAPSVFISFNRRSGRRDSAGALRRALALLSPPAGVQRLSDAAQEIGDRLPNGAAIYDIGLMARQPAVLRVNVGGFADTPPEIVLAALGWERRERTRIGEFARAVMRYARHVKLALDWYGKLLPRVGLEIVPGDGPELALSAAEHARWRGLLAWLLARKVCDARRAAALIDWPGQDEPPDCRQPWPESLVVESMARGASAFSVIGRRLSHIKVDFVPHRDATAKAYFGFGRLWRGAPSGMPQRPRVPRLREAIARATENLLALRVATGAWRDFHAICEGCDESLSAYVAAALAGHGGPIGRQAARETWAHLAVCRPVPGWGYTASIPVDADSTLWVLRLAAALGRIDSPEARRGLAVLRKHRESDGGIASYLPENLGVGRRGSMPRQLAGWCRAHAEVTAAAGVLPGFARSTAVWLLAAQEADGRWQCYWWDEDAYATALAAEHLVRWRGVEHRSAVERAARWAVARVKADGSVASAGLSEGSAFAAACCLRILLCARPTDATRDTMARLAAWLLEAQRSEGGWLGAASMRAPLPADRMPGSFGALQGFAWDENGTFTTSTVLDALGRFAASRSRPSARPARAAR